MIERAFGWISRCRRMARDDNVTASSAPTVFVLFAAVILVGGLARTL
ncbi:transposase [Methylobacterium trifolii]|nr:transposase [Methylobacterium trifolii]